MYFNVYSRLDCIVVTSLLHTSFHHGQSGGTVFLLASRCACLGKSLLYFWLDTYRPIHFTIQTNLVDSLRSNCTFL